MSLSKSSSTSGGLVGVAAQRILRDRAWCGAGLQARDSRFAVIAADNFAFECLPAVPSSPFRDSAPNDNGMMHQQLLAKLGMPLGELWELGPLARHMRAAGRWDAFVSIKPLNITGGTGSPANATAIT